MIPRPLPSLLILAFSTLSLTTVAHAFPQQPVQLIVPFAAGGGLDASARQFAQAFSKVLNQAVVVSNKDGAAGSIGLQYVARAQPDGYTLAYTPAVSLTSEPLRNKEAASYDLASFEPVCEVFENIFSLAVPTSSPIHSVEQLLAAAQAQPGALSYGTSGIGSIAHLGVSDIEATKQVALNHIPYRGDGPMLQDLLTGRLDFGAILTSSISGHLQAGTARLLAVYAERRHPGYPDVPTLQELGIPVVQLSFGGILAPAKTPPAVRATLTQACQEAAQSEAFTHWAAKANQLLSNGDAAAFGTHLQADRNAKAATLKRLKLIP